MASSAQLAERKETCSRANLQGTQIKSNKPTAWAHTGILCAWAVFYRFAGRRFLYCIH